MRSGRLHIGEKSQGSGTERNRRKRGNRGKPRRSKDVNSIEALGSVHLGEHLVDYSVSDSCRVVTTGRRGKTRSEEGGEGKSARSFRRDGMCRAGASWNRSEGGVGETNRLGAILSNSSKNKTQGFAAEARSKRSRTCSKSKQTRVSSLVLPSPFNDFPLGQNRRKKKISAHTLLTSTDVLVQDLRSLDADEVESALFSDGGGEEGFPAAWVAVEEKTVRK